MKTVILSGFMGSGKTTVGPLVAAALGVPWYDTDASLAAAWGRSAGAALESLGEAAFREEEAAVLRRLLDGPPCVVSAGGGTLLDRGLRLEALRRATVVVLEVPCEVAAARIAGTDRPLARHDLARLAAARRGAYRERHAAVDGTQPPERVADDVVAVAREARVVVALGERTYRVHVGRTVALPRILRGLEPSAALGVTDADLADRVVAWGREAVPGGMFHVTPSGERAKDLEGLRGIWDACARAGLDRRSVLVGVGGGVVTDLTCFAAGTWMRGIRWISAPTSLLGMVDAGLGGKGAVDLDGAKNLVGVVHQPSAVVADLGWLRTEPERSLRSGLGEVVKAALLGDEALLALLEREPSRILRRDEDVLEEIVARAAQVKASVVSVDEREAGPRRLLNLGHTLGHALEAAAGLGALAHGEAVAMGLVAALEAGARLGVTEPALAPRIAALLGRLGLPDRPDDALRSAAVDRLGQDKKRLGAKLALALVRRVGEGVVVEVPLAEARALLA